MSDVVNDILDTVIVGAGIAGMTAAIYAARKNMKFKIIASDVGGQFFESGEILNYPGFSKIQGADFLFRMQEQMDFNGVKIQKETVESIRKENNLFVIKTNTCECISKTVIIATGARPKHLDVKGEREYMHKGVTYCALCDGPLFKGKDVVVIGGGNSALEAVEFLMNIAKKVYLLVRGDKLKAYEYLQEAIKKPNVEIIYNATTNEIKGNQFVEKVSYIQNDEIKDLAVSGVFIEIGRDPNTDNFKSLVETDETGHIIIDCQTRTSNPGVFAAGDCTAGHEYQYIISGGQGSMALIKAAKYINETGL
ncbi:FAD-dependent oxidoreductase [Candidatus Woesearchaeota archaeon]|nr:FAD-dependent oxidoreductase [Candidatus Woesearchaeota archaeon]